MSQTKLNRPRQNKNMNQESTYQLIRNKLNQRESVRNPKKVAISKQVRNIISDIEIKKIYIKKILIIKRFLLHIKKKKN